jgi:hypothetical protein
MSCDCEFVGHEWREEPTESDEGEVY